MTKPEVKQEVRKTSSDERKLKIVIQQKPGSPQGFGFKLSIAPGRCIIVESLDENGSAAKCGLANNDEVLTVNEHPCRMFSLRELDETIERCVASGNISLQISRRSKQPFTPVSNSRNTSKESTKSSSHNQFPKPSSELMSSRTNSSENEKPNPFKKPQVVDNQKMDQEKEKWIKELGLMEQQTANLRGVHSIPVVDLRKNVEEAQQKISPVIEKITQSPRSDETGKKVKNSPRFAEPSKERIEEKLKNCRNNREMNLPQHSPGRLLQVDGRYTQKLDIFYQN